MRRSLGGVRVLMRSNFDMKWFQIAVEHERAAIDARKRAEAAEAGSNEMSTAFGDELRAAMVVIAATAFSIDALYVKIDDLLDSAERIRGKRRVASIVETFKIALDLGGRGQAWQKDIPALFSRRDKLVHFRGELTEPGPHPTGKSNVSAENLVYTAEAATRAVDLALEVLTVAYTSTRKRHASLRAWADSASHVPAWFEAERRRA